MGGGKSTGAGMSQAQSREGHAMLSTTISRIRPPNSNLSNIHTNQLLKDSNGV